ncbi:hypothetical protein, variant [Sphaeroforma arctica JP610]|uniref:Uncharacterized protein n=1 Tax=Sphaeroforma arctica JP610 TaxID=667725 RepID=A0A0L0FDN7_9EUKA|nr:hypothetical protein, variant [Sphaeroforma arctica JP610]KNC74168.1 hypothetical protein, variant [Sphaeroforma arctica JP610]|eukprot:XP_014148070.1 hypothetical protein, variant [Sphaeroforma arctica JP610]
MKQATRATVDDRMESVLEMLDIEHRDESEDTPVDIARVFKQLSAFGLAVTDSEAMLAVGRESRQWLDSCSDPGVNPDTDGGVETGQTKEKHSPSEEGDSGVQKGVHDEQAVDVSVLQTQVMQCLVRCVDDMALLAVCVLRVLSVSSEGIGSTLQDGVTEKEILDTANVVRNLGVWAQTETSALSDRYNDRLMAILAKSKR